MQLRVEAENNYALNLFKIAERQDSCIKLGLLAKEVDNFKQDCLSKAKGAEELADNVQSDCVN